MKDWKNYIDDNRNLFDDKEPTGAHFQRFEALLTKETEKKKATKLSKKIKLIQFASIATSIAILIVVGVKFYRSDVIQVTPNTEKNIIQDEFRSTNEYYSQQMEQQIADIMCKLAYTDPENQKQLSDDIQKIIKNNDSFVHEIAKSEDPDIAIRYLVRHYKTNIERLESINEKLGKYAKC